MGHFRFWLSCEIISYFCHGSFYLNRELKEKNKYNCVLFFGKSSFLFNYICSMAIIISKYLLSNSDFLFLSFFSYPLAPKRLIHLSARVGCQLSSSKRCDPILVSVYWDLLNGCLPGGILQFSQPK